MSDPVIKINLSQPTDLDFEVNVQTNCADDKPCVRFSIELEEEKRWLALICSKDEETKKWMVSIPALKSITDRPSYPFILEVILEDYYFVPAKGTLEPVTAPTASIGGASKPTVTATFGAPEEKVEKAEDKTEEKNEKEEDESKEKIEERAPGTGTAYGGPGNAINNKLLKPERPPAMHHVEKPEKESKDIEQAIGGKVTPGDQGVTADNRKQPDGKGPFDAREIAKRVVRDTIKVKKPEGKGYLFNRVGDKAVVEGLEPEEVKKAQKEKEERVKKLLKKD